MGRHSIGGVAVLVPGFDAPELIQPAGCETREENRAGVFFGLRHLGAGTLALFRPYPPVPRSPGRI
jgi:hypothetical protein